MTIEMYRPTHQWFRPVRTTASGQKNLLAARNGSVRRVRSPRRVVAAAGTSLSLLCVGLSVIAPSAAAQSTISVSGGGWGHGVGMSQWGAKGRAEAGQSAAEILAAYYPTTSLGAIASQGPRVKLGEAARTTISMSQAGVLALADGSQVPVNSSSALEFASSTSGVVASVAGTQVAVSSTISVSWTAGDSVLVGATGRRYDRGRLVVRPVGAVLELVLDSLTMQDYLAGLGEVPASWPAQALQAQAIAGRSYAAHRLAHPKGTTFDIYASVVDQAYVGASQSTGAYGQRWLDAVAATDGLALLSNSTVIQALYSSSNGGHSERSDYVFSTALPYFQALPDPFDAASGNSNATWTRSYSGEELGRWIAAAGRGTPGVVQSVRIEGNVGASGRTERATVVVTGDQATVSMTGAQFRYAVNAGAPSSRDLLSSKFSVDGAGVQNLVPTQQLPVGVSPFGGIELALAWGPEYAILTGWVVDGDAPMVSVPLAVYVGGRLVQSPVADKPRPEFASKPEFGLNHGFAIGVPAAGAKVEICVYAIDQGSSSPNSKLGCRTITRTATAIKKTSTKKTSTKKSSTKKTSTKKSSTKKSPR